MEQRSDSSEDLVGGRRRLTHGRRIFAIAGMVIVIAACNDPTPTSPTPVEDPPDLPMTTEPWQGVVPVGGAIHYSFGVGQRGVISVTLLSVSGQNVPSTVMLGLAIGIPDGTDCATTSTTTVQAGTEPQLIQTSDPGVYCARVSDIGNLAGPATVSVTIEHP